MQSKYVKTRKQEIPSNDRKVFELFCLPLHATYLSNLLKRIDVASTCDTNVEYQN